MSRIIADRIGYETPNVCKIGGQSLSAGTARIHCNGVGFAAVLRDIVEWGISPIVRAELCDKQIVLAPQSSIAVSSKSLVLLNNVVCSIESIR